jgi:hypothetical protein
MRAGTPLLLSTVLVLIPCWGCGRNEKPYVAPTVPVKGKITYKGQPLTGGSITFESEENGRQSHGSIQPDGTFVMTTFKEGDGAMTGSHRVAVTGQQGKQVVPVKFRNTSSSKVQVEVTEGKTDYTIDLQ